MKRLAIVITHPIQYYAPLFRLLAQRTEISVKVFYTWGKGSLNKYDPGFGQKIEWDIPLLEGYEYEFLENISPKPGSGHFNGISNPGAIEKITKYSPDAILVYGWSNKSHLKILRHFKGKADVWFRGDSNLIDQQAGWKNVLRSIFLKWVYRNVNKAFYVGSANKEYFKKYGLKEEQLIFAPHAIDNERFSQDRNAEALELRAELGIGESDILVLFAGKLEQKKNPELLLDAFLSLDQENVHILFVGNGVLEDGLKSKAIGSSPANKTVDAPHSSHFISRIHFMDFQNQSTMPVIYQACDLFCLPSKGPGETWGLAVNEAMAAGKAILVSDKVGCAKDLVKPGKNGFIFESLSLPTLNDLLQKACSDKHQLVIMGKESSLIIQKWSLAVQAEAYIKALNTQ